MTGDWTKRALAFIKEQTYPEYPAGDAPTVRDLARRYRVSQQAIVDELEHHDLLCMNVGIGIGNGVHEHESIGDYNFEWMGGDDE
ncbi:MAG: hypothetical protein JRE40_11235 [Deltaproteobacteria bacterium]|nr:hypothetical protein [Deltaproteobacteria bacterium]